jgi:hypothetical protein
VTGGALLTWTRLHEPDGFDDRRVHAFIVASAGSRVEARRAGGLWMTARFSPTQIQQSSNPAKAGLSSPFWVFVGGFPPSTKFSQDALFSLIHNTLIRWSSREREGCAITLR